MSFAALRTCSLQLLVSTHTRLRLGSALTSTKMDLKRVEEHCSATGSGRTLNVEERAGLEAAMAERRLDERLIDIKFWGKIDGLEKDYLIVYGLKPSQEHPQKQFYFWYVFY